MDVKGRFAFSRLALTVRAVLIHFVAIYIVLKVVGQDIDGFHLTALVEEKEKGLDAAVKAANHGIGTATVNFRRAVVVEVKEARVF